MSTALAILAHALRMLVFDTSTTLRVLMPALLLVVGASLAMAMLAPTTLLLMQTAPDQMPETLSDIWLFIMFGAVGLLGYAFMAVLWHRHVLLNGAERVENLLPDARTFVMYVWRAVLVGLAQLIAAFPITLAMGVLGAVFAVGGPNGIAATLIGLLGSVVFIWLALRLSIVLPAAALGYTLPLRESWTITAPVATELWGAAVLLTGLNILAYAATGLILPDTGAAAFIARTVIFIVEGLVFISVLTTLYGHLVEGRSLGQ